MRLSEIQTTKATVAGELQSLPPEDISERVRETFKLRPRDPYQRRLARIVAPRVLRLRRPKVEKELGLTLSFPYSEVTVGERWAADASVRALLSLTRGELIRTVLIPGCYLGSEDVQFWLRRRVERVEGIDVYSLAKRWPSIVRRLHAHFGARVTFRQASLERIPFADGEFDLVASSAVLEHVRNLRSAVQETARVLRPGGWAWHDFGPLYYCFGGDHCIAAYGSDRGYDHLLLGDESYHQRIHDQAFFDEHPDPNLPFWARQAQFSFAQAAEYLEAFGRCFETRHVIVRISREALEFRRNHAEKWRALLDAGVAEENLLVKSLSVVLRKPA